MIGTFFVRNGNVCRLLLLLALAATASCAWAQNAPADAKGGMKAGSADSAFNAGWSNIPSKLNPSDSNDHPNFGGTFGVNLSGSAAVLGEYTYQRMSPLDGVGFNTQLFGGAFRYSFPATRVVPYLVFGGGGARLTGSESGVSVSANGSYFGSGAGASIFLGRSWGIRPEFRYNYLHLTFGGVTQNENIAQITTGLFVRFGGRSSKSQLASVRPNVPAVR